MQWLRKHSVEILLILLTGLIVNVCTYLMMHGYVMTFNDTDDYMRLVRMKELFLTRDWNNNVIARCNYPLGGELHWSRLYDMCWFPLMWLVRAFCSDQARALAITGFIITPIIGAIASIVFFKIMHYIFEERSAFIGAVLFAAHPILRASIAFGHPDYHGFIIFVMLMFALSVCHIIATRFQSREAYIFMGFASAVCIWTSPETLIPLLAVELVLIGVGLVKKAQILNGLYAKNMIATICMITLIANDISPKLLALLIALMLLMLPYSTFSLKYLNDSLMKNWHMGILLVTVLALPLLNHNIAYDKISIVHVALYMYGALFCSISRIYETQSQKTRVLSMLAWGMLIALIYISMYPKFLYGMAADIDDFIKTIWLDHVSEMKSPYDSDLHLFFYGFAALNIAAIYAKISEMMKSPLHAKGVIWLCFIACTIVYTMCSNFSVRMLPYAVVFSLPLLVNMGMSDFTMQKFNSLVRISITALITVLLPIIASGSSNDNEENENKISNRLYEIIDNLSPTPVVIMAHTNDGPELLYRTKHCVVGCPYHRQTEGIARSYIALNGTFDEKRITHILKQTRTSYIFVRKAQFTATNKYCLGKILAMHTIDPQNYPLPTWIELVKLPDDLQDFVIARYKP